MTGYIFLGMAFGILLHVKGYGFVCALLMSLFIYAGSMQYVAVSLLAAAFHPAVVFGMTLMVNARHLFDGLAMLDRFRDTERMKPYLIFGLTDETFSILCGTESAMVGIMAVLSVFEGPVKRREKKCSFKYWRRYNPLYDSCTTYFYWIIMRFYFDRVKKYANISKCQECE